MKVPPTLTCHPVTPASPPGLKKLAEPSEQGLATPVPARPIPQVPSSYNPKPWAPSQAGKPATRNSAYRTDRRIRSSPDGFARDGETGWPRVALAPILVKPMRANASALFRATFGAAPRAAASAPGRANLIGEHTDYNGGPVLPVACAVRTVVAVGPAELGVLEMVSTRDGQVTRIDYRAGRPAGRGPGAAGGEARAPARAARPPAAGRGVPA